MAARGGREVKPVRPRKQTSTERREQAVKRLADNGTLEAALRVPDAVGPLALEADLRSRDLRTSVSLEPPQEGRPKTRITWLLRQLRNAPDDLRIDVSFPNVRETSSLLLGEAREYPERLLSPSDLKRPPRAFTLTLALDGHQSRARRRLVRQGDAPPGCGLLPRPGAGPHRLAGEGPAAARGAGRAAGRAARPAARHGVLIDPPAGVGYTPQDQAS
jgi:hypothetical protein